MSQSTRPLHLSDVTLPMRYGALAGFQLVTPETT